MRSVLQLHSNKESVNNTLADVMEVAAAFSIHQFVDMFSKLPEAAKLFKARADIIRTNALGSGPGVPEPLPRDLAVGIWLCAVYGPTAWRVIDHGIAGRLFYALNGGHHNDYQTIVQSSLYEINDIYNLEPLIDIYGKRSVLLMQGLSITIHAATGSQVSRTMVRRQFASLRAEAKSYHERLAHILTEVGWEDPDHYAKAACCNIENLVDNRARFMRYSMIEATELDVAQMCLCLVDPTVTPQTQLADVVDYKRLNVLKRWVRDTYRWMDSCSVYKPFGSDEAAYLELLPQLPGFWRDDKWDGDAFAVFAMASIILPLGTDRTWTKESQFTNFAYRPTKGIMH